MSRMFKDIVIIKYRPNGDVIHDRRMACGIGLRKVAKIMGISPSYLSKIEKGKISFISKSVVDKIKDAIGE